MTRTVHVSSFITVNKFTLMEGTGKYFHNSELYRRKYD
jgi:hypothetical protein